MCVSIHDICKYILGLHSKPVTFTKCSGWATSKWATQFIMWYLPTLVHVVNLRSTWVNILYMPHRVAYRWASLSSWFVVTLAARSEVEIGLSMILPKIQRIWIRSDSHVSIKIIQNQKNCLSTTLYHHVRRNHQHIRGLNQVDSPMSARFTQLCLNIIFFAALQASRNWIFRASRNYGCRQLLRSTQDRACFALVKRNTTHKTLASIGKVHATATSHRWTTETQGLWTQSSICM